jgi:hypothetical protein
LYSTTIKVTSSNGQVGTPDLFRGIAMGSIQTSDFKLYFLRALLHRLTIVQRCSLIFAFSIFFIAHFLLVENTYKNPYSLKAVKGAYFPQKLTPKTSNEPRYKLFPKHVLSCILKRSSGCFVWAAPSLL